jgi:hypothetical protein
MMVCIEQPSPICNVGILDSSYRVFRPVFTNVITITVDAFINAKMASMLLLHTGGGALSLPLCRIFLLSLAVMAGV